MPRSLTYSAELQKILELGEGQFVEFKSSLDKSLSKEMVAFTNAGILYFAKNPYKYIISSKIRCVHFKDDERIDILDKKVIDRGIIGNIQLL